MQAITEFLSLLSSVLGFQPSRSQNAARRPTAEYALLQLAHVSKPIQLVVLLVLFLELIPDEI